MMSQSDPTYARSDATRAGSSGVPADGDCPGFDPALCGPEQLVGRWVRSPSKFVGWDVYMEFFGLEGAKALQETEEPQEHVIVSFSKEAVRIRHRLPWRDGLDAEYTVPIDGTMQPIPPAMVARASSSWKVNDLMSWAHAWDHGEDGNPLHRGLRTEQKLTIGGQDYALRYWRSLIRPDEMRVNVEVTFSDTGKYAVHTQRFFKRIDVHTCYAVACTPGRELQALPELSTWTHNGHAVRMAVLPKAANMPPTWADLSPDQVWQHAEAFPTAGRSAGSFLSSVRAAAREAGLWVVCGLVLQNPAAEGGVLEGVALIGADGWLHGVHCHAEPEKPFAAGQGDWPATQRARPFGVYDTELGRLAVLAKHAPESVKAVAAMGAQVVVVPPSAAVQEGRVTVRFLPSRNGAHAHYTSYELCGPEPTPADPQPAAPLLLTEQDGALTCE